MSDKGQSEMGAEQQAVKQLPAPTPAIVPAPEQQAVKQLPAPTPANVPAPADGPASADVPRPEQQAVKQLPAPTPADGPVSAGASENNNEDSQSHEGLSQEQKMHIAEQVENAREWQNVLQALEDAMPPGVCLNFKQVQAALHPDKFQEDSQKAKANDAFQKIQHAMQQAEGLYGREIAAGNNFYFGRDDNPPQPHVEGELRSYHYEAQREAFRHLEVLYNAVHQNPSISFQPTAPANRQPTTAAKEAVEAISEINTRIMNENLKMQFDRDLGTIRCSDFVAKWVPIAQTNHMPQSPDRDKQLRGLAEGLSQFCNTFHYPEGWARAPPVGDDATENLSGTAQQGPPPSSDARNTNFTQPMAGVEYENGNHSGQTAAHVSHARNTNFPQPMAGFQYENGSHSGQTAAHVSHNRANQQSHASGGTKQVIAIAPRTTKRAVTPGYTSTGEKILFIQRLGEHRARFVVETSDGMRRLVESGGAGGSPAIEGAKNAGVPETTRGDEKILELRAQVRIGGDYGLTFVAVGEWDTSKKRLPFIIVGFYHRQPNSIFKSELAISRSSLGKIVAPREAERLIAETITGNAEISLTEALISQTSLSATQRQDTLMGLQKPLSLPSKTQEPLWWFQQPNFQQQQPCAQQPFAQQPFAQQQLPQELQPRPFYMQPQPIFTPPKQGYPVTSGARNSMSSMNTEL